MKRLLVFWNKFAFVLLIFFVIGGFVQKRIVLASIICMIGPILFAILGKGRFWCKYLCPRGSLFDHIVSKFSQKKSVPNFFRSKGFRIGIVIIVFSMFGMGIKKHWGNALGISMLFHMMIMITTFVGILLSFFMNHRAWCSFCPMGSIASFIAYLKKK